MCKLKIALKQKHFTSLFYAFSIFFLLCCAFVGKEIKGKGEMSRISEGSERGGKNGEGNEGVVLCPAMAAAATKLTPAAGKAG